MSDVRDQQRERRQHPRTRISWPVLVEVGARRYACQAVDISAQGAKVSPHVPLRSGTAVRLQFVPPDGPLVRLGAVVWRVDADVEPYTTFLAQTGAPVLMKPFT